MKRFLFVCFAGLALSACSSTSRYEHPVFYVGPPNQWAPDCTFNNYAACGRDGMAYRQDPNVR